MPSAEQLLASIRPTPERPLVVVTGAGVSAASGIPTFRGPEGYWTVGSVQYHPQEMATRAAWRRMPREVWRWYLFRRGVCRRAAPNDAHRGLVALERRLGDAFRLVTQNVDGLHVRAGTSRERIAEVHGDIDLMRDVRTDELVPMPDDATLPDRDAPLDDELWAKLVNPRTGERCRPHVLWFDEVYDERLYRAETALGWGRSACAVVVLGTSGAARMPWLLAEAAIASGAVLVDVNPEDDPFRELASSSHRGAWWALDAVAGVARIASSLSLEDA